MKTQFAIFYGKKTANEFMHNCDVFERSKMLVNFPPTVLAIDSNNTGKVVECLLKGMTDDGCNVAVIYTTGNKILWQDEHTKILSNGIRFVPVEEALKYWPL